MAARGQKYPVESVNPTTVVISGSYVGINGASPTTVVGSGFTVARSGEGVCVVTFAKPLKGFVSAQAWANDTGEYHEVSWATSVANRTLTITHKTCAYADIATGPAAEDVCAEIGFRVEIIESDLGVVTGI